MRTTKNDVWARVVLSLAVVLVATGAPASDDVPDAMKRQLEAVVKQRAADLYNEKDASGLPYKRGTYSKNFRKVDDKTYVVTFHQDTIQTAVVTRDQLKVERYLLTLKQDESGTWKVADQAVQDTYDQLFRENLPDSEFFRFDSMSFDREGLKVTSGPGYIYKWMLKGKPAGFRLTSSNLAFTYAPPADMGFYGAAVNHYGAVRQQILKEHPEDIDFKPERLTVSCDDQTCESLFTSAFKGLSKIDPSSVTSDSAFSTLMKAYDESAKFFKDRDNDNPFGGFDRLPEPENRFWRFSFKRDSAKDHTLWVAYDNYDAREVDVFITGYGRVFSYNSEDTRKKNLSPYELEKREDEEVRDYDLKGVVGSVDISISGDAVLDGDVVYTVHIKRDLKDMPFYISRVRFPGGSDKETKNPKLFVNSIRDGDGNELTWVKLGAFSGIVMFPKPIAAKTDITLRLNFTNLDSVYQLNPSYAAMDRGGWLPFVRFGDMIDKFDLVVRTPAKYKVLGIGKDVSDTVSEGIRTTRWTSPAPVSFPTIIFGEYESDTSEYKATKLDGTEIPVNVYVDKVSMQAMNTSFQAVGSEVGARDAVAAFRAGARDIRGKQLQAVATQASVALDLYKKIYEVDYPFAKLDLVADPLGAFYGQAPASIIYLGFGVFRAEGALAADSDLSKFNKDVVAHETGHQWWGSLICNANDRNYWFVETLAELSSALYVEEIYGKKKYLEKVADWRRNVLDASPMSNVQDSYTVWAGEGPRSPIANIYNKGPYAFHVLRETFGDEKFFEFLKELAGSLKHQEIVTRDIQDVAERVYGGTMEWFFDQWIRGIGIPQYAFYYTKKQTEDGKWLVEGTIRQRVVYGPDKVEIPGQYFRAAVPITFITYDGKTFKSKPVLVQGPESPFRLKIPEEPAEVKLNADGEVLAHDILVNRSW